MKIDKKKDCTLFYVFCYIHTNATQIILHKKVTNNKVNIFKYDILNI